jgi:hypothetical protein
VRAQGRLEQAAQVASTTAANTARRVVNSYTLNGGITKADGTPIFGKAIAANDDAALAEGRRVGLDAFKAQAALVSGLIIDPNTTSISINRTGNTIKAQLTYTGQIETLLMRLYGINSINLNGQGSMIVGLMDIPQVDSANISNPNGAVLDETWNAGVTSPVVTGSPTTPVINDWYSGTAGSAPPVVPSSSPVLNHPSVTSAMRVGNPDGSIARLLSKKVYLAAGKYQLRYWYRSTVVYPDYEPVHICGTFEAEMNAWTSGATRTLDSTFGSATTDLGVKGAQTARAGVYLVPIVSNPQLALTPPTLDSFAKPPSLPWVRKTNMRQDNSVNRVDICAYSSRWIERNVPLEVTGAGYFWLSFVAETPTTTTTLNGFYLGRVQLCRISCKDPPTNNSPWVGAKQATTPSGLLPAGTNLFSDNFEAPLKKSGDPFELTSGTIGAGALYEKPIPNWHVFSYASYSLIDNGAVNKTTKAFVYGVNGVDEISTPDGKQYVHIDKTANVSMGRRLLLLPGYYRLNLYAGNQAVAHKSGDQCIRYEPTLDANGNPITNANGTIATHIAGSYFTLVVFRSDWSSVSFGDLGFTSLGNGVTADAMGCGTVKTTTHCYRITATQFYDFAFGVNTLGDKYFDASNVQRTRVPSYDRISIDFLSIDLAGGQSRWNNNCQVQNALQWFQSIGGAAEAGVTTRQLDRVTVTAPFP